MHHARKLLEDRKDKKKGRRSKLLPEHLKFLTDNQTLKKWKDFSLSERCVLFHRYFPDVKISTATLHKIYKKENIKFKKSITKSAMTELKKDQIIDS